MKLVLAIDFAATLADAPASKRASVFASRDYGESPHVLVHTLDIEHPCNGDSDSRHNAN